MEVVVEAKAKPNSELARVLGTNYERFPVIGDKVDMRLFDRANLGDSAGTLRPAARKLSDHISACPDFDFSWLIAVSGSGKTSALFDLAREHFVIYVQCTPPGEAKR